MYFSLVDGLIKLNFDEVRTYPEFKKILERDRGSEGDADGRKKLFAFKELLYIYHVVDLRSAHNMSGYRDSELHLKALKDCQLPSDWKPDKYVKEAMVRYASEYLELVPTLKIINTVLKGMRVTNKVTAALVKNIEDTADLMEKLNNSADRESQPVNISEQIKQTNDLLAMVTQLNDIASTIPKTTKTLEALKETYLKESSGDNKLRGGHEKGLRADPKPQ